MSGAPATLRDFMNAKNKILMTISATALAGGLAAQAAGAPAGSERAADQLPLLERPAERLEKSIDLHRERQERLERRREARREARVPDFESPESLGVSQSTLDAIASCESGGDPAAVSSDGTYRGKYQFDSATWASMGGSGDPAAAPEAEQDMRAAMLYAQAGSSPWPVCG
jgi:soluble lytic murein transglycosylase-like protein